MKHTDSLHFEAECEQEHFIFVKCYNLQRPFVEKKEVEFKCGKRE